MQIEISGRHFKVTEGLRDHVIKKLEKLDRYGEDIISIHIIFEVEKIDHICEICIQGKQFKTNIKKATSDMYATFDEVLASSIKKWVRHHDREKDHRLKSEVIDQED